jgi:hypothetical protein
MVNGERHSGIPDQKRQLGRHAPQLASFFFSFISSSGSAD